LGGRFHDADPRIGALRMAEGRPNDGLLDAETGEQPRLEAAPASLDPAAAAAAMDAAKDDSTLAAEAAAYFRKQAASSICKSGTSTWSGVWASRRRGESATPIVSATPWRPSQRWWR